MPVTPKILAWAGSLRKDSYNKRLVKIAAEGARRAGADVTLIDLCEYPLPLFDEDLEQRDGLPVNGRRIKDLMLAHHGFLVSCPEYNSSITAVLKNVIDWASRPVKGEAPLNCFAGKVVGLMSASTGALGGLRGLFHVRDIFINLGSMVLPGHLAVGKAAEAFDADGQLRDGRFQQGVSEIGVNVTRTIAKLYL